MSSLSPDSSVPPTTDLGPKTCRSCWHQSLQREGSEKTQHFLPTGHTEHQPLPLCFCHGGICVHTRSMNIWNLISQTKLGHWVSKHWHFIKPHHLERSLGSLIYWVIITITVILSTNCLCYTVISKLLWITENMSHVTWSQIIHQKDLIMNKNLQPFNTISIRWFISQMFTVMLQNSSHALIFLRSVV